MGKEVKQFWFWNYHFTTSSSRRNGFRMAAVCEAKKEIPKQIRSPMIHR